MNVLILDDNKYIVDYLVHVVNWEGLGIRDVRFCYDIEKAKQIVNEYKIDIVIVDIELSKGTGFDFLEWAKLQGKEMKAVILTSFAEFDYAKKAIILGCSNFLLKPVEPETVEQEVRKLVLLIEKERSEKELVTFGAKALENKELIQMMFWENVTGDMFITDEILVQEKLDKLELEYEASDVFLPLLFSFYSEETEIEKSLFYFIINNILEEMTQNMGILLESFYISGKNQYIMIMREPRNRDIVEEFCKKIIPISVGLLKSSLNCYIGEKSTIFNINMAVKNLEELYIQNKYVCNEIFYVDNQKILNKNDVFLGLDNMHQESTIPLIEQYIKDNLDCISRSMIADQFYISPNYLSKLWKKEKGLSLSEYIRDKRMQYAKFLLLNSNNNISKIAELSGYPSFAYFTKTFKTCEGITPNDYRKRYIPNNSH